MKVKIWISNDKYWYNEGDEFEVKEETAIHYIVVSGEDSGKLLFKGHCTKV